MKPPILYLSCVISLAGAVSAQASSFKEVRDRVYAQPYAELPSYQGLSLGDLARALTGMASEVMSRARATFADSDDFKPAAPKLLHPMGVCAEGTWSITEPSVATGLFVAGTRVRAMVRMSTGDKQVSREAGKKRIFGLAVKLFPSQSETASVRTANLHMLDENGLDGSEHANYMDVLKFQNEAPGGGAAGFIVNRLFLQVDSNPKHRPLYALAETNGDGSAVAAPLAPEHVELVPRLAHGGAPRSAVDFREELLGYPAGEIVFDIVLWERKIGQLALGAPVASQACDQELHFHHHPNR